MMGAGKSSVGKLLAERLDRPFFDVDSWIEDEEGLSVATIFETRGESAFRELEARALPSFVANPVASVLSVGGGVVTDEGSRKLLHGNASVVWLRADHDTLAERVGDGSDRPLLAGKDVTVELARLAAARAPLYAEVAHVIVDVDDLSPDDVVDRVVAALS
jgi:shikimate kinase